MSTQTFEERVKLIFDAVGVEQVEKDLKRVEAKLMDMNKFQNKFGVLPNDTRLSGLVENEIRVKENLKKEQEFRKINAQENTKYWKEHANNQLNAFQQAEQQINQVRQQQISNTKKAEAIKLKASRKAEQERNQVLAEGLKRRAALQKAELAEAQRFKGEYMGIMFAGMQLQAAFGGLFRNMITQYKEFTKDGATPLSNSLTRLEANWKFLKFAIVEAAAPMLMRFADTLAGWANSIAKMDPDKLSLIMGSIIGLATVGGIMNIFGQGALFFSSIASAAVTDGSAINKILTKTSGLDTNTLKEGANFYSALGRVAIGGGAIAFAAKLTFDALDSIKKGEYTDGIFELLGAGLSATGGARILSGKKGGGKFIAIAAALDLIADDRFFTSIGYFIAPLSAAFVTLVEFIQHIFTNGIRDGIINGGVAAIRGLETLFGGPVLSLLGVNLGWADSFEKMAKEQGTEIFDWGKSFEKALPGTFAQFKGMDTAFGQYKDSLDSKVGEYKTSVENTNYDIALDSTEQIASNLERSSTAAKDLASSLNNIGGNYTNESVTFNPSNLVNPNII